MSTTKYTKYTKGEKMNIDIDWTELAKALWKAAWPFIAGAVGGLFAGCTVGGIGPNFFGA